MTALEDLLTELDSAAAYSLALIEGLSDEQVLWRPHEQSSAIGWHLGHQAVVNHFLLRNLTAAEVSFNADFDAVFDSATPEEGRGDLPSVAEILDYRSAISASVHRTIGRIIAGDVGAPEQLSRIADGLLRAAVNHEYQHAKWVGEVRDTMVDSPAPTPASDRLTQVEGYWMVR